MPVSKVGIATRAFVAVLLALARAYQLSVQVNRDSSPDELLQSYKRVLLKAHQDKGGSNEHMQRLQAAKETWQPTRSQSAAKGGRPRTRANDEPKVARCRRSEYRAHVEVVLLTYQGWLI